MYVLYMCASTVGHTKYLIPRHHSTSCHDRLTGRLTTLLIAVHSFLFCIRPYAVGQCWEIAFNSCQHGAQKGAHVYPPY